MNSNSSRHLRKYFSAFCLSLAVLHAGAASASDYSTGGKDWRASFSSSYIYSDNVVETPSHSAFRPAGLVGEDDSAFNWSASGTYRFKYDDKLSMTADYMVDMTTYFDLDAYNLTAQFFGVNPLYEVNDLISISFRNWFVYNIVDGVDFSRVYVFNPSFNHMHPKLGFSRIHYTYTRTDNIQNQLRNHDKNAFGVDHVFFFSNYRHYVGLGYEFVNEESTNAFDREMHIFTARLKASLPYGLSLLIDYKLTNRDYSSQLATSGLILREDARDNVKVKLEWMAMRNRGFIESLKVKLAYDYVAHDSNLLVRDFNVNQFIVGVDAKF